jgi:hypothetical protein
MCTNVNRKKEEAPSRYIRDYWDQHVADSRIQFQTWGSQADPIAPHPVYGSYPEDYLAYLVNLIAQQAILRVVKGTWLVPRKGPAGRETLVALSDFHTNMCWHVSCSPALTAGFIY